MELEKLINRITDIAEDKGWSVYTEPKGALVEFEFSQSTDFGQDFSFSASMNDGDIYSLIKDVNDYYEGYDPDEEALLWVARMDTARTVHLTVFPTSLKTWNRQKVWSVNYLKP